MQGWIKLHRQLLGSDTFRNEKLLKVWIYCLLKATHKEYEQIVGRQKVRLRPGQFVFGRKRAAEFLEMPESTIRDYIKILAKSKNIDIKTTNKYSVISVINWDLYQSTDEDADNKTTNKWTTNGQQMDTNKNGNNGENKKIIVLTPEEQEFLSVLETVKNYPLDREADLEMYERLKDRYPDLNLVESVKDWAAYKMDNPLKLKDNPRSQVNTSCKNHVAWGKNLITQKTDTPKKVAIK